MADLLGAVGTPLCPYSIAYRIIHVGVVQGIPLPRWHFILDLGVIADLLGAVGNPVCLYDIACRRFPCIIHAWVVQEIPLSSGHAPLSDSFNLLSNSIHGSFLNDVYQFSYIRVCSNFRTSDYWNSTPDGLRSFSEVDTGSGRYGRPSGCVIGGSRLRTLRCLL